MVDHQIANFEFNEQVTAAFSMEAMSHYAGRRTNIFGTAGVITGDESTLTITQFVSGIREKWDLSMAEGLESGHGSGDHRLVRDFVKAVRENNRELYRQQYRYLWPVISWGLKPR